MCSFVQSMGKKLHKCMGIFIIDSMVILPFVKISHWKKYLCGKFTKKISHIWKFYHENMENFPFDGNISKANNYHSYMEICLQMGVIQVLFWYSEVKTLVAVSL
jgi:hypothetical protein